MNPSFPERSVKRSFSGGEKNAMRFCQMAPAEPVVAISNETDSGPRHRCLRIRGRGVNQFATADNATLLITHYQRLLDVITPDLRPM